MVERVDYEYRNFSVYFFFSMKKGQILNRKSCLVIHVVSKRTQRLKVSSLKEKKKMKGFMTKTSHFFFPPTTVLLNAIHFTI